jgi:dihydropteroate synthase
MDDWFYGKRTYLMGILNITPDSFSDGGEFNNLDAALSQARNMVNSGVDIIDIGGQSTRPGAEEITETEELTRVIPIIKAIRQELSIPISIDTTRANVAQTSIKAGANLVNDISGATFDPQMLSVVASLDVPIVLMHIRGTPKNMQELTDYEDVVEEVYQFLASRIDVALALGIKRSRLLIDPGIGFAKTYPQNIQLLKNLSRFRSLEVPILVGVSRKSFIGRILDKNNPKDRVWGTAAACCAAIAQGAHVLRVHDVPEIYDVCRVADTLLREPINS